MNIWNVGWFDIILIALGFWVLYSIINATIQVLSYIIQIMAILLIIAGAVIGVGYLIYKSNVTLPEIMSKIKQFFLGKKEENKK